MAFLRRLTSLRSALLLSGTAGSFALFVAVAHPHRLAASLGALPAGSLVSAGAAGAAGVMLVAIRWRSLLGARSIDASTARLFAALTVGSAVNNLVPARAGDAVRIESAHRLTGASRLAIAGSLVGERILDAFALAVLVAGGALCTHSTGTYVWVAAGVGSAVVLAVAAVARLFPAVDVLRRPRVLAPTLGTTFGIWLADVVMYGALARGFGLHLSFGALLLLVGLGNLALAIPGTAAGVGSFELVTLAGAHGIGVGGAAPAAFVLAVHAVIVLPTTVTGLVLARWALPSRLLRHERAPVSSRTASASAGSSVTTAATRSSAR